jgi:hypothetical protein
MRTLRAHLSVRALVDTVRARSPQRLRQLGDVRSNPSCLVTGQQLGCRPTTRVILTIDEGQCLAVVIAHDEARCRFPRRSTAAESGGAAGSDHAWLRPLLLPKADTLSGDLHVSLGPTTNIGQTGDSAAQRDWKCHAQRLRGQKNSVPADFDHLCKRQIGWLLKRTVRTQQNRVGTVDWSSPGCPKVAGLPSRRKTPPPRPNTCKSA